MPMTYREKRGLAGLHRRNDLLRYASAAAARDGERVSKRANRWAFAALAACAALWGVLWLSQLERNQVPEAAILPPVEQLLVEHCDERALGSPVVLLFIDPNTGTVHQCIGYSGSSRRGRKAV